MSHLLKAILILVVFAPSLYAVVDLPDPDLFDGTRAESTDFAAEARKQKLEEEKQKELERREEERKRASTQYAGSFGTEEEEDPSGGGGGGGAFGTEEEPPFTQGRGAGRGIEMVDLDAFGIYTTGEINTAGEKSFKLLNTGRKANMRINLPESYEKETSIEYAEERAEDQLSERRRREIKTQRQRNTGSEIGETIPKGL